MDFINKNISNTDEHLLTILLDMCVMLYDPSKNNYMEIESKFYLEYKNIFNNITKYSEHKEILFFKILEIKNKFEKKNSFKYYCVYMLIDNIIKICPTDNIIKFINSNKNILYCFEYIDMKKMLINEIVEKYNKLYKCKIQVC